MGRIIFQAAGAYTAAVLTLGPAQPASQGGFQQYVGGAHWPFPLPILAAGLVGGLLAVLVGGFTVRRLRSDYEAMVMLVVMIILVHGQKLVGLSMMDLCLPRLPWATIEPSASTTTRTPNSAVMSDVS